MIDIKKYQLADHIFSHSMDAQSKSRSMGFDGAIHVHEVDGNAYYMPGADHKVYIEYMEQAEGIQPQEEDYNETNWLDAIRVVVETIMQKSEADFKVIKVDDEQRIIYGWASVTKVDDQLLMDRQGDYIETDTLHKAVNTFMKGVRVGKLMHQGDQVGQIIHSFPVSKEIMGALGIQTTKEGWITGYYVEDDNLWADVKSGKYAAFSIGGAAIKEEYDG